MRELWSVVSIVAVAWLGMPAGAYATGKAASRQDKGTVSGTLQDPKAETSLTPRSTFAIRRATW